MVEDRTIDRAGILNAIRDTCRNEFSDGHLYFTPVTGLLELGVIQACRKKRAGFYICHLTTRSRSDTSAL